MKTFWYYFAERIYFHSFITWPNLSMIGDTLIYGVWKKKKSLPNQFLSFSASKPSSFYWCLWEVTLTASGIVKQK